MRLAVSSLILITFFVSASAQPSAPGSAARPASERSSPADLANAALAAHGGDKLRYLKTLIVRGTVDVTLSASSQAIAGGFVMIISGDKYRIEISNPFQPLKQVFDGTTTSSTIQNGFNLPPVNRLGLPLLARVGETGFSVAAPPSRGKEAAFRVTSPDGWFTDFIVDGKTGLVRKYSSAYELNGRVLNTVVEIDKFRIVDGVTLPERFAQRFDLGQLTAYADFKAKEILVNSEVADDVFTLSK